MAATLAPDSIKALMSERTSAEQIAQSGEGAPPPAPPSGPAAPAVAVVLSEDAHRKTIDFAFTMAQLVGGRAPREGVPAIVAELSFPAAQKYGGDVPYMAEIALAVAALIVYRECFAARPDEPTNEPAKVEGEKKA